MGFRCDVFPTISLHDDCGCAPSSAGRMPDRPRGTIRSLPNRGKNTRISAVDALPPRAESPRRLEINLKKQSAGRGLGGVPLE